MRVAIKSFWSRESGVWSIGQNKYIGRSWSPEKEKEIHIEIDTSRYNNRPIVYFIGGPTGHESYYLESLADDFLNRSEAQTKFYICTGTINSWPSCYVLWEEFKEKIRELLAAVIDKVNMDDDTIGVILNG